MTRRAFVRQWTEPRMSVVFPAAMEPPFGLFALIDRMEAGMRAIWDDRRYGAFSVRLG